MYVILTQQLAPNLHKPGVSPATIYWPKRYLCTTVWCTLTPLQVSSPLPGPFNSCDFSHWEYDADYNRPWESCRALWELLQGHSFFWHSCYSLGAKKRPCSSLGRILTLFSGPPYFVSATYSCPAHFPVLSQADWSMKIFYGHAETFVNKSCDKISKKL